MEPEKKSNGALIGLIVIVFILIIGGLYVWQSKVKQVEQDQQNSSLTAEDTNALNTLEQEAATVNANIDLDVNSVQ